MRSSILGFLFFFKFGFDGLALAAQSKLCGQSNDMKSYLSSIGLLEEHAERLLAHNVDVEVLCHAPVEWIYDKLKYQSNNISNHRVNKNEVFASSTYECRSTTLHMVNDAIEIWNGKDGHVSNPSQALHALTAVIDKDPRCCAPYREFSRLFLGGNSPFIQLKSQSRKLPVLETVIKLSQDHSNSQWRELAGYAAAHSLHFSGSSDASKDVFQRTICSSENIDKGNSNNNVADDSGNSKLWVATVASKRNDELENLEKSALLGGVQLTVLGLGLK
jgi:hypothetical protein